MRAHVLRYLLSTETHSSLTSTLLESVVRRQGPCQCHMDCQASTRRLCLGLSGEPGWCGRTLMFEDMRLYYDIEFCDDFECLLRSVLVLNVCQEARCLALRSTDHNTAPPSDCLFGLSEVAASSCASSSRCQHHPPRLDPHSPCVSAALLTSVCCAIQVSVCGLSAISSIVQETSSPSGDHCSSIPRPEALTGPYNNVTGWWHATDSSSCSDRA